MKFSTFLENKLRYKGYPLKAFVIHFVKKAQEKLNEFQPDDVSKLIEQLQMLMFYVKHHPKHNTHEEISQDEFYNIVHDTLDNHVEFDDPIHHLIDKIEKDERL